VLLWKPETRNEACLSRAYRASGASLSPSPEATWVTPSSKNTDTGAGATGTALDAIDTVDAAAADSAIVSWLTTVNGAPKAAVTWSASPVRCASSATLPSRTTRSLSMAADTPSWPASALIAGPTCDNQSGRPA